MGATVPEGLSERIFKMFATGESGPKSQKKEQLLTFEDMVAFYLVFTEKVDSEMAQASFLLIKLTQEATTIARNDLEFFCKRIAHMSEIYVSDFYKTTMHDPKEEITL
mmetsp:Transcript_11748/g.18007  ORF Transcript_11748/g.18007 Transcript_11748/m.18007 type:complete len:108 (+) Transcript_11748:180-503(+)